MRITALFAGTSFITIKLRLLYVTYWKHLLYKIFIRSNFLPSCNFLFSVRSNSYWNYSLDFLFWRIWLEGNYASLFSVIVTYIGNIYSRNFITSVLRIVLPSRLNRCYYEEVVLPGFQMNYFCPFFVWDLIHKLRQSYLIM